MQRVAVELGVHGDGGDAELAGGADDAHGDLAPVGDQDLLQHGCQCRWHGRRRTPPPTPARTVAAGLDVEHVVATGSTNADLLAAAADRPDAACS